MVKLIYHNFLLKKGVNVFFFPNRSVFLLKGYSGLFLIKMPSYYFYSITNSNSFKFLFIDKFRFNLFFKNLINKLIYLSKIFFFRIRIKGLGYRIRKISTNLFRFFFTSTNFFYFHVPSNVLVKYKMRKMILLTNDKPVLKTLIAHLLMLKKIIPYFLRGVFSPRNIIVLKPGKKSF